MDNKYVDDKLIEAAVPRLLGEMPRARAWMRQAKTLSDVLLDFSNRVCNEVPDLKRRAISEYLTNRLDQSYHPEADFARIKEVLANCTPQQINDHDKSWNAFFAADVPFDKREAADNVLSYFGACPFNWREIKRPKLERQLRDYSEAVQFTHVVGEEKFVMFRIESPPLFRKFTANAAADHQQPIENFNVSMEENWVSAQQIALTLTDKFLREAVAVLPPTPTAALTDGLFTRVARSFLRRGLRIYMLAVEQTVSKYFTEGDITVVS